MDVERTDQWGVISDTAKTVLANGARALKDGGTWRSMTWASLEPICDPFVIRRLKESVDGWAHAAPDQAATDTGRGAERTLVDRFVPMAYLIGRLATGTADQQIEWPEDRRDALLDECDWILENTEDAFAMPGIALDMIEQEVTDSGYPGHEGLLNTVTMAHDDALLFAVFEYDRLVLASE
jgi:hypothetical protein